MVVPFRILFYTIYFKGIKNVPSTVVNTDAIIDAIAGQMPVEPNEDQVGLFRVMAGFLLSKTHRKTLVIRGYAGTGKTTVLTALRNFLEANRYMVVMLAPTGRAAKVMTQYSGKPAFTIHRIIYGAEENEWGGTSFSLAHNKFKNTFFIVDEAGMIGNEPSMFTGSGDARCLLDDLFEYVENGMNCHLILSGDTAQLPPVGSSKSFGLDPEYIVKNYSTEVHSYELWNVVRQEKESGILANATRLREQLKNEDKELPILHFNNTDFRNIDGYNFPDELETAYAKYGQENVLIITRSNKKANLYNGQVRYRLLYRENKLDGGDQVMVIRNNYYWNKQYKDMPMLANGESMEIVRVKKIQEKYGFEFAEAEARLLLGDDDTVLDFIFMLDTIGIETATLSAEKMRELFDQIRAQMLLSNQRASKYDIYRDPYFNALQIKFSYAVTCHKAQGGQWPVVFIDAGVLLPDMAVSEYVRWLYTAITRGVEKVFFVGYPENLSV